VDGDISVCCISSYRKQNFEELMLGFSSEKQFCLLSCLCQVCKVQFSHNMKVVTESALVLVRHNGNRMVNCFWGRVG